MKFINKSESTVKVAIGKGFYVKPGETCDIADGYANPTRGSNGARSPSVIERIAPQLVPADPSEYEIWKQIPAPAAQRQNAMRIPTVEDYMAQGVPRGRAEMLYQQNIMALADAIKESQAVHAPKSKLAKEEK